MRKRLKGSEMNSFDENHYLMSVLRRSPSDVKRVSERFAEIVARATAKAKAEPFPEAASVEPMERKSQVMPKLTPGKMRERSPYFNPKFVPKSGRRKRKQSVQSSQEPLDSLDSQMNSFELMALSTNAMSDEEFAATLAREEVDDDDVESEDL